MVLHSPPPSGNGLVPLNNRVTSADLENLQPEGNGDRSNQMEEMDMPINQPFRRSSRSTKGIPPAKFGEYDTSIAESSSSQLLDSVATSSASAFNVTNIVSTASLQPKSVTISAAAEHSIDLLGTAADAIQLPNVAATSEAAALSQSSTAVDHQPQLFDADSNRVKCLERANAILSAQLSDMKSQFASLMSQLNVSNREPSFLQGTPSNSSISHRSLEMQDQGSNAYNSQFDRNQYPRTIIQPAMSSSNVPAIGPVSSHTYSIATHQPTPSHLYRNTQPTTSQIGAATQQMLNQTYTATQSMPSQFYSSPHPSRRPQRPQLYDLPIFNGVPEEWPMFIASFNESTTAYEYTPLENMIRLDKSLKGAAREAVETILIHPSNVPVVIEQLQFRFGRPEHLIRSQLSKVRLLPTIPDSRLDMVVPFATKVQNLCTLMESTRSQQHLSNPMLLEELVSKLPMPKRLEWAQFSYNIQPYPSLREFSAWMQEYAKFASLALCSPYPACSKAPRSSRQDKGTLFHAVEKGVTSSVPTKSAKVCALCAKGHSLSQCAVFLKKNNIDRWKIVKDKRVCFSCLVPGHIVSSCRSKKRCDVDQCGRFHHRLLHEMRQPEAELSSSVQSKEKEEKEPDEDPNLHARPTAKTKILFRVLPVKLYGPNGIVSTFALLDDGSSVTIINDSIASQLGLTGRSQTMSLTWIGKNRTSQPSSFVSLEISGVAEGSKRYEMKKVRTYKDLSLPIQSMDVNKLKCSDEVKSLPICGLKNAVPEILIGLDNWRLIMGISTVLCDPDGPVAVQTLLGWVVYGGSHSNEEESVNHITEDSDKLSQLVNDYFALDSVDATSSFVPKDSPDNMRARKILQDTTIKLHNRFETGLLWKEDNIVLPDSLPMAKKRLASVKRTLLKDSSYAADYENIIREYIAKGYARLLSADEAKAKGPRTWYLPHFCVRNLNKGGKLRLVFDAAAKVDGTSLNSSLLKGPEQCQDLLTVLHKFREKPIGVCADIREMFHQITIRKEDQDAQRFLWQWRDEAETLDTYVMQVVVFGATSSPCSAEYVKNYNAQQFASEFPQAVKIIIENHYVDDLVCSFENEEEALAVTSDVIKIHLSGGFELRKFSSNSSKLLNSLREKQCALESMANMDIENKSEKILGMHWIPTDDVFIFRLNFHRTNPKIVNGERFPTKRECLSILMSIFDPFGLLADFTIHGKLMLQSLWKTSTTWDEEIPVGMQRRWRQWISMLEAVKRVRVPRCYASQVSTADDIQLHIFVDASEEAFAAVGFWRIVDQKGNLTVAFVAGKTRCAPFKLTSIPRLELQAAILGVRLRRRIVQSHNMHAIKCIFWSDSRTVLSWIKSANPRKYKPFVGHRIAEILELSNVSEWRWVPTKINVADIATRAKYLTSYQPGGRWMTGPKFLLTNETRWPKNPDGEIELNQSDDEEIRAHCRRDIFHLHVSSSGIDLNRFSCFLKLKRVVAWVLRWRIRHRPKCKSLCATELQYAENVLCRMVQKQYYTEDYTALKQGQQIEKSSQLYRLTPCLDENDVIRLSGRIDSAVCVPVETRRPVILPKECWLSKLIVRHIHQRFHHQNTETVVCEVRRSFWIPHLRTLAKTIARECQYCKVKYAKPTTPQMGQLPMDRLTPFVRPFTFTGVDFMGPYLVAIGRRREKRWIALFTCLTIRAVHLEVATDLSTDAFLICLRNFVNRRGVPVRIRSDNGTNFVGAEKELKQKVDMFDQDAIQTHLSSRGIQWTFNCPSNPSAGGCWERLVRSVKRVLLVTLKEIVPKEETLRSVIIEAENIVNSRPLTHLPLTSEEEEPLTPNHFTLGCANSTQTPGSEQDASTCLRKQWRIAQALKNRFWHRWIAEYLPDLTRRTKWYARVTPLTIGDLVIICDSNMARSCWRRGRILKVFPGRDGQVRTAAVQTSLGVLNRPASKLAKLDVGESSAEAIHGGRDVPNAAIAM